MAVLAALPITAAATREEDLQALRARIEALRAELHGRESERRGARDALRKSEIAISEATRALAAVAAERNRLRAAAAELAARRRGLEQDLAAREAALGRLLAARASARTPDVVRLLLSGENPSEVARQLHYLAVLSRAEADAIRAYRADLAELGRLREASERRAGELRALEARERVERDRLLAERRERRRVLERISGELRSGRRRMRRLQADEQRLSRVVREIGRVLATRPGAGYGKRDSASGAQDDARPFESLRGHLGLPVRGRITLRFHAPKGNRPGSKGLFIRAPQGEPVRAVAAGRVVFADWMRGFGNLLIIDHGEAYLSVYGNNESLLKRTGDAVSAGETVATVGASGGRQESGVYFELRHLGEAFDPMRWMRYR